MKANVTCAVYNWNGEGKMININIKEYTLVHFSLTN